MPELSVIVPVYKVEKYLPKCIDSILAQTFTDFELILIDDGSPDRCGAICDEYAAMDSRIIVIHQQNKGVSAARNAGLKIAKGKYIGFVDSDDWINSEMYAEMIKQQLLYHTDVIICGVNYYSDSGILLRSDLVGNSEIDGESLLKLLYGKPNPIGGGCCNKLFLRTSIQGVQFPEGIRMAEDWIFLFQSFEKASTAYHMPLALYNVTERPGSATRLNEADTYYDILFGGKSLFYLLLFARKHSLELEQIAIDKYMDDCLRYSNIIREYGKQTETPYRWKLIRIRFEILKRMPRVIIKKLLPKEKIHGYLYSTFMM